MKRKLAFALCTALALHLGSGAGLVSALAQEKADLAANGSAGQTQTMADKRPVIHPGGTRFGAYDPHGDFGGQTDVSTEHLFLPWEDVDLESLRMADAYALQRKRKLLVTIEPWSWSLDWKLTPNQLRDRMLAGEYDANMEAIAGMLAELKSPVIVRWGQEMEDTSGRFSWAGWVPQDYVKAYRHAMDIVRKRVPNVQLMWSPKGLPNLGEYYPGDDYVDLVGLSVFGRAVRRDRVRRASYIQASSEARLRSRRQIQQADLGCRTRMGGWKTLCAAVDRRGDTARSGLPQSGRGRLFQRSGRA